MTDRLSDALDVSGLGTWEWELVADRERISARSHALLGYGRGELAESGEAWRTLLHADDRAVVLQHLERIRRGEAEELDVAARFAARSGEWRWIRCRGRVVERDAEGRPCRVVGTHADVTAEKEVEAALRRSEERYRTLVESQGEGIGIVDEEERFIFANVAAERIFGVPSGAMIGRNLKEFVAPEEFQRVLEQTGRRRTGNRDTYEMTFTRGDGLPRVLLVTATPRVDSGGNYSGAFGVFRDITERKRAEEALRESEERYRQLIESLPHGVGVIQNGRIMFANRAAVEILGVGDAEDLGGLAPLTPLVPEERERVRQMVVRLLEGTMDGPLHYMTQGRRPDGLEVPLEVYVSSVPFRGEPAAQVFFMDISGRLSAEEERRQLEEQLLQARKLESIGRLAGGIAHEFNNLLTPVIINASMALQDLPESEPRREDLEDILSAATRAKKLTRQLLAFGRQQILKVRVVDIDGLIDEWSEMLGRLIREDIVVELDLSRDRGDDTTQVRADPVQLQQVLIDLVLNASDSTPEGGKIQIRTGTETVRESRDVDLLPGQYVVLTVSDTGKGMDPEAVSRIFEPFYSTKDPALGAGLGLAAVHGVVMQHHGHIEVQSQPGRGSTFRIFLPRARIEETATPSPPPRGAPDGNVRTVLVVEDEPLLRRQICRILRRHNFQVLESGDGLQALELARAHDGPIDLLVTDVVMPRLGGRELAEQLCPERPALRVVLMSGYTSELMTDREEVLLEKPFTLQALVQRINEALEGGAR